MRKVLIIIDMLNDFVSKDGALYVDGAETLIPNINKLIAHFAHLEDVIFVCDNHEEDDIEFKIWPPHAIINTEGAKIHQDIKLQPKFLIPSFLDSIPGKMYKADLSMFDSEYMLNLISTTTDELYITGVATDYCIMSTVLDSTSKHGEEIRGAISRGFKVNIIVDAIAGVDEIPGVPKTKGKVAESLIMMGKAGVNAVYTEDILNDKK